jgi:hypothetical protein
MASSSGTINPSKLNQQNLKDNNTNDRSKYKLNKIEQLFVYMYFKIQVHTTNKLIVLLVENHKRCRVVGEMTNCTWLSYQTMGTYVSFQPGLFRHYDFPEVQLSHTLQPICVTFLL